MKERYKKIRNRFEQIIYEKNEEKEKRNKSYIQSHINNMEINITDNESIDFNLTKNSYISKDKIKLNKNNKVLILNKKFNILKKAIEKLQCLIEKNINNENLITNEIIENISVFEQFYKNELIKDQKTLEINLKIIKEKYLNEMENIEEKTTRNDIKEIIDENTNKLNETINKINNFSTKQNNYFKNINIDINDQFNSIYEKYKEYKINENEITKDLNKIKNKINIFGNKENKNRENFKDDILNILESELNKLKRGNMINSYK